MQEAEKSRTTIKKLERSLAETRIKLVRLLPKEGPNDDQVKQAFEDLCQNIESWVDIECSDLDDLKGRLEQSDWTEQDLEYLQRHISNDDLELARRYPEIGGHIIMHAIFSILYDACLADGRWVLGMNEKEELLLDDAASQIHKTNGPDGAYTEQVVQIWLTVVGDFAQRRWRSETYLALSTQQNRVDKQTTAAREISEGLSSFLIHFRTAGSGLSDGAKVQEKLVAQALKLAHVGRTSMTEYIFQFPVNSSSKNHILEEEAASSYKLVDAESGMEMEANKVQPGGKLRLCVFPALMKVLESGKTTRLASAMVAIEH